MSANREGILMKIRSHGTVCAILLTPLSFYFASGVKTPMEQSPAAPETANIAAKSPIAAAQPQSVVLPKEVKPLPSQRS